MRDAPDSAKYLTASRLIDLLSELPPESRVSVNRVGNLYIANATGNKFVAFIDFINEGEVCFNAQ